MMTSDRLKHDVPELLIPFDGSRGAEKVLQTACRTARRDGALLTVLCVVKLPANDEDAWCDPTLEATAMRALTLAQRVCHDEGVVAFFELSHDRSLAAAIVAEARRSGSALIGLSLEEHEPGETAFVSETVQQVLASAPCTVLLEDLTVEIRPDGLERR